MRRDQVAFLLGGVAFGILLGYGLFNAVATRPGATGAGATEEARGPMGPAAMSQGPPPEGGAPGAASGGAPMLQEINALKQAVQQDPANLAAWTRLANLYHDAGMFDTAIEFYRKAVDLAPRDPNIITDLGICYEQLEQFPQALELFDRAQSIDPNHWQSLYNIAVVSIYGLVDLDRAAGALARLGEVNPAAPNLGKLRAALDERRSGGAPGGRP